MKYAGIVTLAVALGLLAGYQFYSAYDSGKRAEKLKKVIDWQPLQAKLGDKFIKIESPLKEDPATFCENWADKIKDPYVIASTPWASQSTGSFEAWQWGASAYAVEAHTAQDVAEAVAFARAHGLKVVIKGTGHDFLGRSTNPDALLIWTHKMKKIELQKQFLPEGAPLSAQPIEVVSVEAGSLWSEVYDVVVTQNKRFVMGGGCMTVGAAGGYLQGGGFGLFAKTYGTGGSSLVQAEVVLASGELVLANEYQNPELLWALKGGGGSTFGVVTKVFLRTFDAPKTVGTYNTVIRAKSDNDFMRLIDRYLSFYMEALHNPKWGEQVIFRTDNSLKITMHFQGLEEKEIEPIWQPFVTWVKNEPGLSFDNEPKVKVQKGYDAWSFEALLRDKPTGIVPTKNGEKETFYWKGDERYVLSYWSGMHSRWIEKKYFFSPLKEAFVQAVFQASRFADIDFYFNKGMSGSPPDTLSRVKNSPINPIVLNSPALIILGSCQPGVVPGAPGCEPDYEKAKKESENLRKAADILIAVTPGSGSYISESDYHLKDWQKAYWGENYPRLLKAKRLYDPENFFTCHHAVGSESSGQ